MSELWIVQPYVPAYRVPFFEHLAVELESDGITLRVVAGTPRGAQAARGDATRPDWLVKARDRTVPVAGRTLTLTSTYPLWRNAEAVIVPHMGSSLDAYRALFRPFSRRKVGVWGHIASYVNAPHPVDAALERWQLRRADQVFAYTPSGARFARSVGVAPDRVTTVMNAVDTDRLRYDFEQLTEAELQEFRTRHKLPSGPLAAYIGGLDADKRIDFLAATLDELSRLGSSVHLVVGGTGVDAHLLNDARLRGQVTMLGYIRGTEKAALLKSAQAIVNPGRIGLLAVEALAVGRPVFTTLWPYHAPEAEYLREGESRFSSPDSPNAFANLISQQIRTGVSLIRAENVPSLTGMVHKFAAGARHLVFGQNDRV